MTLTLSLFISDLISLPSEYIFILYCLNIFFKIFCNLASSGIMVANKCCIFHLVTIFIISALDNTLPVDTVH